MRCAVNGPAAVDDIGMGLQCVHPAAISICESRSRLLTFNLAMIFDFIILLLCAVRLYSHRSTTLGSILFRDGIAYFCSAFIVNLIQTIMAGLQLNPVMSIITLPFALVVSVIAATTVFRNVFMAYDNFHGDPDTPNANSGRALDSGPFLLTGTRILFNHNTTTNQLSANEIPLGQDKSDMGPVSVCKAEVDAASQTQSKS